MTLEETTQLYASVLRQLLPVGGYDTSPNTEALAVDVYAHAKLLAQADIDAKRLLNVLEGFPPELISEYETEYGLPLKCTVNAGRTLEERLQILNWVRTSRNVLNRAYLEQLLAIFGVVLIDVMKFKPLLCTAPCNSPVNTEQLRYKVFLRLQYPVNADMSCIVENYLPGYLRIEWIIDMPWGDWIINPGVTVNASGIAHYTAYKTNQREYYDSYANLDLTAAIVQSLHDSNMQQWQAVKDAANELTGVTDWVLDPANNQIKYKLPSDPTGAYLYNKPSSGYGGPFIYTLSQAQSMVCQTVNSISTPNYKLTNCNITGVNTSNPAKPIFYFTFDQINSDGSEERGKSSYYDSYGRAVAETPEEEEKTIPLETVAQKVISNASSSNQAISLLAEAYLENVAKSIFAADESKQFVKLSDLLSQFELNKTLRT